MVFRANRQPGSAPCPIARIARVGKGSNRRFALRGADVGRRWHVRGCRLRARSGVTPGELPANADLVHYTMGAREMRSAEWRMRNAEWSCPTYALARLSPQGGNRKESDGRLVRPTLRGALLGLEIGTSQSTLPVGAGRFGRTPHIALFGAFLALRASDCNGWPRRWVSGRRRDWDPGRTANGSKQRLA